MNNTRSGSSNSLSIPEGITRTDKISQKKNMNNVSNDVKAVLRLSESMSENNKRSGENAILIKKLTEQLSENEKIDLKYKQSIDKLTKEYEKNKSLANGDKKIIEKLDKIFEEEKKQTKKDSDEQRNKINEKIIEEKIRLMFRDEKGNMRDNVAREYLENATDELKKVFEDNLTELEDKFIERDKKYLQEFGKDAFEKRFKDPNYAREIQNIVDVYNAKNSLESRYSDKSKKLNAGYAKSHNVEDVTEKYNDKIKSLRQDALELYGADYESNVDFQREYLPLVQEFRDELADARKDDLKEYFESEHPILTDIASNVKEGFDRNEESIKSAILGPLTLFTKPLEDFFGSDLIKGAMGLAKKVIKKRRPREMDLVKLGENGMPALWLGHTITESIEGLSTDKSIAYDQESEEDEDYRGLFEKFFGEGGGIFGALASIGSKLGSIVGWGTLIAGIGITVGNIAKGAKKAEQHDVSKTAGGMIENYNFWAKLFGKDVDYEMGANWLDIDAHYQSEKIKKMNPLKTKIIEHFIGEDKVKESKEKQKEDLADNWIQFIERGDVLAEQGITKQGHFSYTDFTDSELEEFKDFREKNRDAFLIAASIGRKNATVDEYGNVEKMYRTDKDKYYSILATEILKSENFEDTLKSNSLVNKYLINALFGEEDAKKLTEMDAKNLEKAFLQYRSEKGSDYFNENEFDKKDFINFTSDFLTNEAKTKKYYAMKGDWSKLSDYEDAEENKSMFETMKIAIGKIYGVEQFSEFGDLFSQYTEHKETENTMQRVNETMEKFSSRYEILVDRIKTQTKFFESDALNAFENYDDALEEMLDVVINRDERTIRELYDKTSISGYGVDFGENTVEVLVRLQKDVDFINAIDSDIKIAPTRQVNDAIIKSNGEIIETSIDDNIIATKNDPQEINMSNNNGVSVDIKDLVSKLNEITNLLRKIEEKPTSTSNRNTLENIVRGYY